ncbi:MAG TPA: hypothetical protein VIJ62_12440 [Rhizomicrobium sp.]
MGVIGDILAIVGSLLGAALSGQATSEFRAWTPWLVHRLIQRAVINLPARHRARCEEEWQSYVNEIPGEIGKLIAAIGFLPASRTIVREVLLNRQKDRLVDHSFDALSREPTMEEILASIRRVIAEDGEQENFVAIERPTGFRHPLMLNSIIEAFGDVLYFQMDVPFKLAVVCELFLKRLWHGLRKL